MSLLAENRTEQILIRNFLKTRNDEMYTYIRRIDCNQVAKMNITMVNLNKIVSLFSFPREICLHAALFERDVHRFPSDICTIRDLNHIK